MNRLPWYFRLPVKWTLLGLTALVVSFPHPGRLIEHISRWRDPNALIEPDAIALQPLRRALEPMISPELSGRQVLRRVERFVYERVPYEWDWNTWGNADYIPTVTEVMEKGHEDCDGRAVVAASLLRGLGYDAELVTDFAHVWVKTESGETMGPGKTKVIVVTKEGWQFGATILGMMAELTKATAYGTAVFPLFRELIIVAVFWLLLLRLGQSMGCRILSAALMVSGLLLFRVGGENYQQPRLWIQLTGAAVFLAGVILLYVWCKRSVGSVEETENSSPERASPTSAG